MRDPEGAAYLGHVASAAGIVDCIPSCSPLDCRLTSAVHVTAARLRMLLNVNGLGGAAARDEGR